MKTDERNYVAFEFPSKDVNEAFASSAVKAFILQQLGNVAIDEASDIRDSVREAVSNAIHHAYSGNSGKILVHVSIFKGNIIEIKVQDWGCGIKDIEKAREPLITANETHHSGMGFIIMESFMDTVTVESQKGKGTTVTMKRQIGKRK